MLFVWPKPPAEPGYPAAGCIPGGRLRMRAKALSPMSDAAYLSTINAMSAYGWRRMEPVPLDDQDEPRHLLCLLNRETMKELQKTLPGAALDAVRASAA